MRVVVAGGHGKIALILEKLLAARGDGVVGLVRNPEHEADVRATGAAPVLCDLESAALDEVAATMDLADAVVFAAGAGPGSGVARKDTVDRAAAVLTADAAERAGVRRYLQISTMGAGQPAPQDGSGVWAAYLAAKGAAEADLRGRDLDWTILRPGALTDDLGTGRVLLADSVPRGKVPRADVAAVIIALLEYSGAVGRTLELVSGQTPIDDAVRAPG